jgi:hypothetical protein
MLRNVLSSLPVIALGLGAGYLLPVKVMAATPDTAPDELITTLEEIESAANRQALDQVMAFYSESFTSSTGFDYAQLQQNLDNLWQQYEDLTYDIELLSWESLGNGGYAVETLTRVEGTMVRPERTLMLTSEITSRQRIEEGQISSQEILSESSQLSSGDNPPTVAIQLPETIPVGQTFAFDAIAMEPLEGRALMGVAIDEGVTARDFLEPRPVVLDVLSAGGLYKLGTASEMPDQRWLSAVILREDGFIINTRRVQIVDEPVSDN